MSESRELNAELSSLMAIARFPKRQLMDPESREELVHTFPTEWGQKMAGALLSEQKEHELREEESRDLHVILQLAGVPVEAGPVSEQEPLADSSSR